MLKLALHCLDFSS